MHRSSTTVGSIARGSITISSLNITISAGAVVTVGGGIVKVNC